MPQTPQPYVEKPNLRASTALIIDDPAPCINPLWYFRRQVDKQSSPAHEQFIPLDFMRQWCDWIRGSGVRGDFTVLPFPAGLGRIDRNLSGCDPAEARVWIELAKHAVSPQFDIHPEILTHTNALDIATESMLPMSEHEWTEGQNEETLADYFSAAFRILADAGLPGHGITQPCYYRADESVYARALLTAEKRVNGRSVTHNFVHMDSVSDIVPPRVTHLDRKSGEAVVSVWCGNDDYIWNTQDREHTDFGLPAERLADRYITEDGRGGRLPVLIDGGGPLVIVTHWQSLYSNGTRLGLKTVSEFVGRLASARSEDIEWCTVSQIATRHLAATSVRLTAEADPSSLSVVADSPFGADVLTVSIPAPWPLSGAPQVRLDGVELVRAHRRADLEPMRWLMRGSVVTTSFAVEPNRPRRIEVRATASGAAS